MAATNFVDYVKIYCRSGAGGPGSTHLHRDKMTAKGGPDGGDGGRGGACDIKRQSKLLDVDPFKIPAAYFCRGWEER